MVISRGWRFLLRVRLGLGRHSRPHNDAIGRPKDARLLDGLLHGPRPASLRSEHHASTVIQERESQFDHHVQCSPGPATSNSAVTSTRQSTAWPKTHAAKLNDAAVASALDDTAVMRSDGGIDEIATEPPQARQGAILVRRGEFDCNRQRRRSGLQRACAFPPWRTLWASLRIARNPAHSRV